MSKVEITGPRSALLPVLETIQKEEALQVDPDIRRHADEDAVPEIRPVTLDPRTLAERLFLEDLKLKVERLLTLLPKVDTRESYLRPGRAIGPIAGAISKQLETVELNRRRRDELQAELAQANRFGMFLGTVASLAPADPAAAGRDYIGVEVRDAAAMEKLARLAGSLLRGAEVRTTQAPDGTVFGLLTTEKEFARQLKEGLRQSQIPELDLPAYLEGLSLSGKIDALRTRCDELTAQVAALDQQALDYSKSWRSLYENTRAWLQHRLSLLRTSASVYETDRCFVIYGWMPSARVDELRRLLTSRHGDALVVEEREILGRELDDVPVALRNPVYFRPFELLVRLLPVPRYTSVDPTPFVGIFFPLFFGMILGDVGYGVVLLAVAVALIIGCRRRHTLRQAGQILLVASIYAIVFGLLYGEYFGDLGARAFGLGPGLIDRRASILPMLYFALAVGFVHVLLGLLIGVFAALKGHRRKEAWFRSISVVTLLCLLGLLASYVAPFAELLRRPMLMTMLVIIPVLLLTGGVLAPFELLRTLGNIVSYARIMAIGLASVLLAYVANSLAGAMGSLWAGIAVAVLLHTFNLLLGVFAPTVHALRLHYVEFFSKFFESGGRRYEPLKKVD